MFAHVIRARLPFIAHPRVGKFGERCLDYENGADRGPKKRLLGSAKRFVKIRMYQRLFQ